MRKLTKILILIMLISVMWIPGTISAGAEDGTNSITVDIVDINTKVPLQGIELSIYKVADEKNYQLTMTDEFKNSGVTPEEFYDYGDSEKATLKLEEYIVKAGVKPLKLGISDQNGKVYFGALTDGLYLVKHENPNVPQGENKNTFSMSSFLIHAPRINEDGSRDPNVVCKPKGYVEDETYVKTTRVVNKVWKDNCNAAGVRPEEIIVGLFDGETLVEKVSLNNGNNWTYKWTELKEGPNWIVKELTVLDRYESSTEFDGVVYTITNTLKEKPPTPPEDTPPEGPNTGDQTNIILWVIAGGCSVAGVLLAIFLKPKNDEKNTR